MALRSRRQSQSAAIGLPADRRLRRRAIALLIAFALAVIAVWLDNRTVKQSAHYVAQSSELMMLSQRLARDTQQALSGDAAAFGDLMQSRRRMDAILLRLDKGDSSLPPTSGQPRAELDRLIIEARKTGVDIQAMEAGRPGLVTVATAIMADSDALLQHAQALIAAYQAELANRHTDLVTALSGAAALLLLLLLVRGYLSELRRRALEAEQANQHNRQAILALKQEIAGLAEGDLTIKATVGDDSTAAIAEAVNHTIDQLRNLVTGITEAATRVSHATAETRKAAQDLQNVARTQVRELHQAETAVEQIANSAQQVDSSAFQSAQVARRTLEVTARGAQAVHNTVAGVDGIRGQIQEAAKRIKRLGESSQEIGEIVGLIADLTEQTNVLAVNAAIQAAAAGESGRGFSLVAEEVQRLAERSAEATRQIGGLVTTIQGDTRDAVAAMEKTTQDVEAGAGRSHTAGQALQEIEQVSHELADLIGSISNATQTQTDMAHKAAAAMADILRLTEQTMEGAGQTTAALTALADLAVELRASVAGFKL